MPSLPIAPIPPISPINSHRKKAVNHAATVLLPLICMFCMQRCHRCPSSAWFSIAKRFFPDYKSGFFLRDGIHIQRSCLKRIFDEHQSLLRMFKKKFFSKGSAHGFIPFFVYNIYLKFVLIRLNSSFENVIKE